MGDWYDVGFTVGLGVALGLLVAALFASWRRGAPVAVVLAALAGAAVGWLVEGQLGIPGAAVGGALGALSASLLARGALRRGATGGGTIALFGAAAVAVGALALIPFVGYLVGVLLPAIALRRARQQPERYAGLRTLAK